MAGIYIHIPFCKQACHYCNFHFSTSLAYKGKLVEAIGKEIFLRRLYLEGEEIETVYFGGGTPSLLSDYEFSHIIEKLHKAFDLSKVKEFTLEANPDDLSREKLNFLAQSPVNRLSIGVQSFFDEHLLWMNRAHKSEEALIAIKHAQDAGLTNISIDLIYGIPGLTEVQWNKNLEQTFDLNVPHVSSYCLTVEPKTALAKMIASKKLNDVNDDQSAIQFKNMLKAMKEAGFEHYEISNFAKPGKYALHNTNYWKGIPYLGLGPAAHSFNKIQRNWNIANNAQYIKGIENDQPFIEHELLSPEDHFNEYIMTGLRTQWGINRSELQSRFGSATLLHFDNEMADALQRDLIHLRDDVYTLSNEGKFFADGIASGAFMLK